MIYRGPAYDSVEADITTQGQCIQVLVCTTQAHTYSHDDEGLLTVMYLTY